MSARIDGDETRTGIEGPIADKARFRTGQFAIHVLTNLLRTALIIPYPDFAQTAEERIGKGIRRPLGADRELLIVVAADRCRVDNDHGYFFAIDRKR